MLLYFRSQYFLRLCLILAFSKENGLKYLNNENIQFRNDMKKQTEYQTSWIEIKIQKMSKHSLDFNIPLNVTRQLVESTDLMRLKRCSMDITHRLIIIMNQSQYIDHRIQSLETITMLQKQLLLLSSEISQAKILTTTHLDDLQTLELILNKFSTQSSGLIAESKKSHVEDTTNLNISTIDSIDKLNYESDNKEYFGIRDLDNSEIDTEEAKEKSNIQQTLR